MQESNKTGGIIAGVIALVLIGGGIIWFATSNNNDTQTATETPAENTQMTEAAQPTQDIVEIASSDDQFSTLVAAVTAADLVETLQGDGPFTVFAPTNAAFEKLPAGTLESLLEPANKAQLAGILTYHVVPGTVMASDLSDGQKVKTVNGAELTVRISDSGVQLIDAGGNASNVTATDIKATNGVVHVIDTVVLPE
jgi:uncharacterized surface protein with fasciclin (FAS1) repeats